jgi:hypothetical protein
MSTCGGNDVIVIIGVIAKREKGWVTHFQSNVVQGTLPGVFEFYLNFL